MPTRPSAVDDLFHFFAHLRREAPGGALLESLGPDHDATNRYSLLGTLSGSEIVSDGGDDWLDVLNAWCPMNRSDGPWQTGAIGYVAYDANPAGETRPSRRPVDGAPPLVHLVRYGAVLVRDHAAGTSAWAYDPDCEAAVDQLESRWKEWRRQPPDLEALASVELTPDFDRADHLARIARAVEFIEAGDIYQANVTGRFSGPFTGDLFSAYAALRTTTPNPFFAFLDFPEPVLSTSPERFFRVAGGRVETRPIKGTIRAEMGGVDQAAALVASAKDRAENAMIVDVARNDLGRVCRPGSVRVDALCQARRFNHLYHLESVVSGEPADGVPVSAVLGALFPPASVTGAPKIRAVEVIDELEPVGRGPYCGAIGFFGSEGWVDTAVAIRIAYAAGGRVFVHAGGGIVADSDPEAEVDELLLKAEGLLAGLRR